MIRTNLTKKNWLGKNWQFAGEIWVWKITFQTGTKWVITIFYSKETTYSCICYFERLKAAHLLEIFQVFLLLMRARILFVPNWALGKDKFRKEPSPSKSAKLTLRGWTSFLLKSSKTIEKIIFTNFWTVNFSFYGFCIAYLDFFWKIPTVITEITRYEANNI